eukprot:363836-Chlamydomonas_euryale.AAC.6
MNEVGIDITTEFNVGRWGFKSGSSVAEPRGNACTTQLRRRCKAKPHRVQGQAFDRRLTAVRLLPSRFLTELRPRGRGGRRRADGSQLGGRALADKDVLQLPAHHQWVARVQRKGMGVV